MTRINAGIPPENLTDQHLIAELRELPRIFTAVSRRIEKYIPFGDIPKEFTLGTGHCKFFYDKTYYLYGRHCLLRVEYQNRFGKEWGFVPELVGYNNSYFPGIREKKLLASRIAERIMKSTQTPRYYRENISKEKAIQILNRE